jgi:hypothetical protein
MSPTPSASLPDQHRPYRKAIGRTPVGQYCVTFQPSRSVGVFAVSDTKTTPTLGEFVELNAGGTLSEKAEAEGFEPSIEVLAPTTV